MSKITPKVPYVRLGNSGLKVSKIILGCMCYGSSKFDPWCLDEEESIKHIKHAYDRGIQTFDTADAYCNGYSEIVLGKAIKALNLPREEIVVMTKTRFLSARTNDESMFTLNMKSDAEKDALGYSNQYGLSRKHIFDGVKGSLKRLQLGYIDVLQVHRFDPNTPIEETMQALHGVVQAGYVRYLGMSTCYAWQFAKLQNYAIDNHLTPFISMQNLYNALYREEEREMMPMLRDFGVGSIPWCTLGRGMLARPPGVETQRSENDQGIKIVLNTDKEPALANIIRRVEEVSKKLNFSMAQVAIAWLIAQPSVTAPIVGVSKLEHLDDIIGGLSVKLLEEDIKYISEAYVPRVVHGGHYS